MSQVQLKYLPQYTISDYEQWEGDWELILGIPYSMSPSPSKNHQRTSAKLFRLFDQALASSPCKCEILYELDWRISENSVVRPDLMISCDDESHDFQLSTPKLIIEILSISTAVKDKNLKFDLYESKGVLYYLIVDPNNNEINKFELIYDKYQKTESNEFHLGEDCSFEIKLINLLK